MLEGIPALLGGVACYLFLTDTPEQASWLTPDEKQWLSAELAKDRVERAEVKTLTTWQAIAAPKVLLLALIYFIYQAGSLGVGYWMPQIIASLSGHVTNFQIGLLAMLPYAIATVAMIVWSAHSDRTGERQLSCRVAAARGRNSPGRDRTDTQPGRIARTHLDRARRPVCLQGAVLVAARTVSQPLHRGHFHCQHQLDRQSRRVCRSVSRGGCQGGFG